MGTEVQRSSDIGVLFIEANPARPLIEFHLHERRYIVDVVESLKKDPKNITHPLIVAAIERYTAAIQWRRYLHDDFINELPNPEAAKTCLRRISEALIEGAEQRARSSEVDAVRTWRYDIADAPLGYFVQVWQVLQEAEVKGTNNAEAKLRVIERRLKEIYPNTGNILDEFYDHTPILEFLRDILITRNNHHVIKLPSKGGGAALRNYFLAWQNNVDPKTIRDYLSRGRRALRKIREDLAGKPDGALLKKVNSIRWPDSNPRIIGFSFTMAEVDVKSSRLSWKKDSGK